VPPTSDPPAPPAPPLLKTAKGNAKKPKYLPNWHKYAEEGRLTEAHRAFLREEYLCFDLVKVGSYVINKPLTLIVGGPQSGIVRAATDGRNIFLPRLHPNKVVVVKHELAHNYFKSNLALRLAFVRGLIREFEKTARKLPPHVQKVLEEDLCFLINILDDIRVNSLWGLVYPGDGDKMDEWYHDIVAPRIAERAKQTYPDGDIDNLFTYINLITLGQEAKSSRWGHFEQDILECRDAVLWATFPSCLVSARRLTWKILLELVKDEKPEEEKKPDPLQGLDADPEDAGKDLGDSDDSGDDLSTPSRNSYIDKQIEEKKLEAVAASKALVKLTSGRRPPADVMDEDQGSFDVRNNVSQGEVQSAKTQQQVDRLLRLDPSDDDDFEDFTQASQAAGLKDADEIKQKLDARPPTVVSQEKKLEKSVAEKVEIINIKKEELRAAPMSQEDYEIATKWKSEFIQVMASRKRVRRHQGARLDTQAFIQRRLSGDGGIRCYIRDQTGRGFELVKSFDMSGSIGGVFPQIERLNVVLRKAMDFPFVIQHEQGWNSTESGGVTLFRFPQCRGNEGLVSPKSRVGGITPLPQAVTLAGEVLRESRNERHLFLFSDGFPVYAYDQHRYGKKITQYMDTNLLMEWTHDAVKELRIRRIKVWCWMIGPYTPSEEKMDYMFGHGNWRKIREDQVYEDGIQFIRGHFLHYLRTR
jgi:hypothetical protein